ncbi:MAG: tRNA pseudouridine(38-40) synthase TruA [Chloroflexota bacterium]|nr:tRNA pseudouridine(38-40) synthase TruA [Chloroflexota bacterium]
MAYDGTGYAGFQVQPNAPTVQGELERVLARICGEPVRITGAGRTDAGVHATGQVIDFRTASALDGGALERGVNALLPEDIAISALQTAGETFHSRFSATGRTYEYRIRTGPTRDPLERRREHWLPAALDMDAMNDAARRLVGRHDHAAFAAGVSGERDVKRAVWRSEGDVLRFEIEANAFLRGMVRGIVGTLLWVGRGKISADRFVEILRSRDRSLAGPSAPAQGLCLVTVSYDGDRAQSESESNEDE